uniref:Uncharacterized protein LOC116948868 isoform X3 n=1 Tax=Petromyzon marinus TaxID=7757 RepID=A0AAJ7X5M2_PETMA|nr:uncharacterized protein LOC116948868 isoform X3 [Petromyzon marinus]
MDTETRRRAVWMSVVICILSRITSVHLQASPREYFVAVGQEVTLTCDKNTPGWSQHDNPNISSITRQRGEGSGATDMDLTNSRDFRITVTEDVDQHRASIRIENVQHSDAGVYSCLGKSEVGTESPMMEIITMEVSANPSSVVSEGETVTLTCHISNSAYVQSIVWTHGGTEMNPRNSVLTLHKIKRCQEGAWTCGVKTQTDQASASHDLTVSSQNVCDVKAPAPRKYFVSVGQTVILPCVEDDPEFKWKDHPSSDLALTWRWERQGSGSETIVQYPKQTGQRYGDVWKNTAIPLVSRITTLKSNFDKDNFSIQISKVQHSDAGLYICHFAGYFRTSSLTRELITMQVSANPSSVMSEGETVTLTCHISNSAYVQSIVWTHGGTEMNPRNSVLTLHKVKRCQEGAWTCGVKNQTDQASASHHLTVSSQNVCDVKAPAPRKYFVSVGQSVILQCVEDDPEFKWKDHPSSDLALTWRWERQGSGSETIVQYPKQTGQRYGDVWKNTAIPLVSRIMALKSYFDKDNFSIQISKVQYSDAGLYICHFTGYFRTSSLTRELITMQVSANPSSVVSEGETVTLTCHISNSAYVQSIVWTHGGTEMNPRHSVLTLHKIKRCQEGAWTCGVKPQTDQASASHDLTVSSQNVCDVKAPAPRKYFVSVGQSVILQCVEDDPEFKWKDHPSSDLALTWRWERQGSGSETIVQYPKQTGQRYGDVWKNTAIPLVSRITTLKSNFDKDNFSIQISKVQHSDAGLYICHFAGYFRTSSLTRELITMQVSANPSSVMSEGETVTLTCHISNSAYVQSIVWTHGGTEMNPRNSVLTLHKVKRCQEGAWTCGVKNQTDQASASHHLTVSSQNVCDVKAPAPRKYFVSVGQSVILQCVEDDPEFKWKDHPSSDLALTWRWERQGSGSETIVQYPKQTGQRYGDVWKNTAIPLVSRIMALKSYFDKDNFSIQISKVQYSDAGLYICHFTGYFRTSSLTRELITMQVSANPSSVVSEGETVTLTCHISNSAYVQSIVWTHGGTEMNPRHSVLTLHKIKRCQEGAWTCGVKPQTDQASASHDLTVSSQNVCDVKAPAPRKYFVSVGQSVILQCVEDDPEFKWKDHPSSDLALTWRWERQGSGSETIVQYPKQTGQRYGDVWKNTAIPLVSRITALKSYFDKDNFSIQISKVQYSDAGLYICHFTGYFRTSSLTRELITMQVSANPSRSVTEGETVTLTCLISNSGYRTGLVWYHGQIYISQGNQLTLNKVKRSQQGEWKCFLYHQHHSRFASYTLELTSTGSHVEKAPAVQKYFIHEGGEVSLSCDESDPGFQWKDHSQRTRAVTWKWRSHDGTTKRYDQNIQYPSQPSDYKDQFPLALSKVTFSRGGVYTCEFTGYYRTGTLTMELVTMKVSSNTSNTVAEGESISLTCQLSNDSYAHMVRWIHNGIEISHQSSLVLVKVKAAQSGLWKCSLKRESGEISEVAYNLNVQKIGAEQNAPRNYAATIGEGTTLPCTESDPGFVWRSSSNESRSVTWYWRPRGDSTVRTILEAHPAGPHAAFSSHLNSHVTISSSAFDNDDFSLTISVVNESSAGVYTCQLTGYYRSGSLMSEMFTTQVSRASPYVSVAIGVVLAVLLSAGAAVVVVCYRRRKLNAGPQHGQGNSVNLQEMAAGERTTDENRQAYEEEALVYSQIEALPESSGSQPQHNQNVGVIYASVNAEHTNEVAYSVVQASAADKMKPKVKPKGNGGSPNAVVNRPEHDNNEVVYSVVQVAAAGNMKPKPKPKRDGGDPNAVANRSEHDNNEVVYSVVQAPAAGNIKPKLKPKPKRDGGDPNAVVDRSEHDKNEAVNSMVQAPAAGNMNPNAVVNRPQPEENQVVYSLLSTPNASKPALKPKPNKAVDALYTVVAKKK